GPDRAGAAGTGEDQGPPVQGAAVVRRSVGFPGFPLGNLEHQVNERTDTQRMRYQPDTADELVARPSRECRGYISTWRARRNPCRDGTRHAHLSPVRAGRAWPWGGSVGRTASCRWPPPRRGPATAIRLRGW